MTLRSEDVAQYLQDHPEFFEQYADLLANIFIPHPHGGRAIPISERQIITLREKNRMLEDKLRELISFGEENDAIGEKIHRLCFALLTAQSLPAVLRSLQFNLREDFAIPHVIARLWDVGQHEAGAQDMSPVSPDVKAVIENLNSPYCGPRVADEVVAWFGEDGERLRSFALVALRREKTMGLLVLASEDPKRFYPEMGTLYLKRLGEMASAAVSRYIG